MRLLYRVSPPGTPGRSSSARMSSAFRVAAADTQVDRDFEHFSRACLEKLAELYVGKPFIADHQWSSGNQVARVYPGRCSQ